MYLDWDKHVRHKNNIEEICRIKLKCREMIMIENIGIKEPITLMSPPVIELMNIGKQGLI